MATLHKAMLTAALLAATQQASAAWISVPDEAQVQTTRPVFDRINRVYTSVVTITNPHDTALAGPLRVLITDSNIPVFEPSGYTDAGIPFIDIKKDQLAAGDSTSFQVSFELQRKQLSFNASLQQDNPNVGVYAEAEGGASAALTFLGSSFTVTPGTPGYVSIDSTSANPPEDDNRVGELSVTFSDAGTFDLYARVRVGSDGAEDDSFYAPDSFGGQNDWLLVNNISGYIAPGEEGYTPGERVTGSGSSATNVFKWMRFTDTTYQVNENDSTYTFRYGGREDGLDIDKFVFAPKGLVFTVEALENGMPGERLPPEEPYVPEEPPLAQGQEKFLGGVCCGRQRPNFEAYWNQVTPENAGKWGSVEAVRDSYNWAELDEAYQLAKDNGFVYKHHVLVWGNQQPEWLRGLSASEQLEEIQEWYQAVNERYPAIDFIEVVNEFDNDPPNSANDGPGYIDALRLFNPQTTADLVEQYVGSGLPPVEAANKAAEYDWIINAFQMARDTFPTFTKLMINEYSVINTATRTDKMIEIANLLQARGLIDAIGFQGHAFSTTGPVDTMLENIDKLAAQTGLDLYVTELDIDGPTDLTQLLDYQRLFPMFWEHPAIKGVTVWGYLPGHWRENQGAILAYENGAEKPALVWLRSYMRGLSPKIINPGVITVEPGTATGTVVTDLVSTSSDDVVHDNNDEVVWKLLGGNEQNLFTLDPQSGELRVTGNVTPALHNLYIQVQEDEYTSMVLNLQILVPGDELPPTVIEYDFLNDAQGWRGDYGTAATVGYDGDKQAAVLTPDWGANAAEQVYIKEISLTNFTDATLSYTFSVTQQQIDGGLTIQPFIQTGAPSYSRIYGSAQPLTTGSNTVTFLPQDNGNQDIEIVERVGLQLNGPLSAGLADNVLLENVNISIPVSAPPVSSIYFDFADGVQGLRGDYDTAATVVHEVSSAAVRLLPNGAADVHNYIMEISSRDFSGSTLNYSVMLSQALVDAGVTLQGYLQTGAPDYTRLYGELVPALAGEFTFSFTPADNGSGAIANIQRIALQINGQFSGTGEETVQLKAIEVQFP
ncbi:1,4-beta-xylanase [Alteromonas pelagimontana]|uniref:endo-1,4-beta-xylanase n=1 Tax=Alteromonas pelagimontana TaxID=1858656 RepID=A0A6M4MFC0_9ALTE|nr:endo-1,4-beta-xylanase [Alteromonas pelagimontana]QJR81315.1 1,4-beta-xylanase [Alteromonas pelagimontana]